jgi:hypothetical protein
MWSSSGSGVIDLASDFFPNCDRGVTSSFMKLLGHLRPFLSPLSSCGAAPRGSY